MTDQSLTPEQELVVFHPPGKHARVLAVAGSGKSTTMAHRIKHLILDLGISPGAIQVLMFNSLARKQFSETLGRIQLPADLQPLVHTFHSFSYHLINQAVKDGLLPAATRYWLADKAELIWLTAKRAIRELEKKKHIPLESVDPEEALHAIGLWKGALITPDRAGSYLSPYLPLVYQQFEAFRLVENALTFDDFVPTAIDLLETHIHVCERMTLGLKFLIVDEYQDINYGQQRLIEILASHQADVMVVGDDDQTIYEWRGARPHYIIQDFARVFSSKPVIDYRLSRSFRFGPLLAQCAANVIACNHNRVDKPLVASQVGKAGFLLVLKGGAGAIKDLAEQVLALTRGDRVPPAEIIVLGRLYAQLDNLEAEFLARKIPYRVDGQEPFFQRREIGALLDYLRLAQCYQQPINEKSSGWLLSIANKPSRLLSQTLLNQLLTQARSRRLSPQALLTRAVTEKAFGLNGWQAGQLATLWSYLEQLVQKATQPGMKAGQALQWMIDSLDYLAYFHDYYGLGEHAEEKAFAVQNFVRYVSPLDLTPFELLEHLKTLDTTQGQPDPELIVFTTIFRTKGLEYDYVIVPDCDENVLPFLKGELAWVYDTAGIVQESHMSTAFKNERRLFYVALTRARKGVLIGVSEKASRFLDEVQLPETKEVMRLIDHLSSGDIYASQALLQLVRKNGLPHNLITNLIHGYLPDLGKSELAHTLQVQVDQRPQHA